MGIGRSVGDWASPIFIKLDLSLMLMAHHIKLHFQPPSVHWSSRVAVELTTCVCYCSIFFNLDIYPKCLQWKKFLLVTLLWHICAWPYARPWPTKVEPSTSHCNFGIVQWPPRNHLQCPHFHTHHQPLSKIQFQTFSRVINVLSHSQLRPPWRFTRKKSPGNITYKSGMAFQHLIPDNWG